MSEDKLIEFIKSENNKNISAINKQFEKVNETLNKLSHLSGSVKHISAQVTKNNIKLNLIDDSMVRVDRRHELIVRGIPYVSGENILDILQSIGQFISFRSIHDMPFSGFRLPSRSINLLSSQFRRLRSDKNDERDFPPSIIMKFKAIYDREDFLKLYFDKKNMSTKDIGFMADSRIYIGENFTSTNHKILMAANKLKRNGVFSSVYTNDGLIYVKKMSKDKKTLIRSILQLDELAVEHSENTH